MRGCSRVPPTPERRPTALDSGVKRAATNAAKHGCATGNRESSPYHFKVEGALTRQLSLPVPQAC